MDGHVLLLAGASLPSRHGTTRDPHVPYLFARGLVEHHHVHLQTRDRNDGACAWWVREDGLGKLDEVGEVGERTLAYH